MKSFWITFTDGSQACCQGENPFDAKVIAEKLTGKTVGGGQYRDFSMKELPYPAKPIIWSFDHPVNGRCPEFCYSPAKCAGQTACPQSYACSE